MPWLWILRSWVKCRWKCFGIMKVWALFHTSGRPHLSRSHRCCSLCNRILSSGISVEVLRRKFHCLQVQFEWHTTRVQYGAKFNWRARKKEIKRLRHCGCCGYFDRWRKLPHITKFHHNLFINPPIHTLSFIASIWGRECKIYSPLLFAKILCRILGFSFPNLEC